MGNRISQKERNLKGKMDKFLITTAKIYRDWNCKYLVLYESGQIGWIDFELLINPEFESDWRLLKIPDMKQFRLAEDETGITHDVDILQWEDKDFTFKCAYVPHLKTWLYVNDSFQEYNNR